MNVVKCLCVVDSFHDALGKFRISLDFPLLVAVELK